MSDLRRARIGEIVSAVAEQLLRDCGRSRIALLDDGSPEVELAAGLLAPLGAHALLRVTADERRVESVLHSAGVGDGDPRHRREAHRLLLRIVEDAVPASAGNKTALLLGGDLPPEHFLPLGDLYASEIGELCGGWSAPAPVQDLARAAGGVQRLDGWLRARVDGRGRSEDERLPEELRVRLEEALARGAPARIHPRIVPKIGTRTLGVDLFE